MPVDGGSRGPGGNSNVVKPRTYKGDGLGANRNDGPPRGGSHEKAVGATRGRPDDLRNGSPMRGPGGNPQMASVLKYVRNHGSASQHTAPGSESGGMHGGEGAYEAPYPTGGAPREEKNEGNDVPGESEDEMDQEGGSSCGHPGCTKHGSHSAQQLKYSKGNKETREPSMKGGRY